MTSGRFCGGAVFDRVAAEYDRHRPTYPDELVDRAFAIAGLAPGDRVLEIGCGTGQLTRGLAIRGVRVTALEPGERLLALAERNLRGMAGVEFVHQRLEDATLDAGGYRAGFAASAIHWVDPDVGWRRIADALVPGGTLALIQYVGLDERRSAADQAALRDAIAMVAPGVAAGWPSYRDLDATVAGARDRRANVSEVWAWLGGYGIARAYAADLFDDAELTVVPMLVEHTSTELNALLATMSFWAALDPEQRDALARETDALQRRLGRPIRSSNVAVLVTARGRCPRAAGKGPAT